MQDQLKVSLQSQAARVTDSCEKEICVKDSTCQINWDPSIFS